LLSAINEGPEVGNIQGVKPGAKMKLLEERIRLISLHSSKRRQLLKDFAQLFPETHSNKDQAYSSDVEFWAQILQANSQRLLLAGIKLRHFVKELVNIELLDLMDAESELLNTAKKRHRLFVRNISKRLTKSDLKFGFLILSETYNLSLAERFALITLYQLCWLNVDLSIEQYAVATSNQMNTQLELMSMLGPTGKFVRNNLMTLSSASRVTSGSMRISPLIFNRLTGLEIFKADISSFVKINDPVVSWETVILPENEKNDLLQLVQSHINPTMKKKAASISPYGNGLTVMLAGLSGTGKTSITYAIGSRLGLKVLSVESGKLAKSGKFSNDLRDIFLQAKTDNAIVLFDECEELLADDDRHVQDVLREFELFDGLIFLITNNLAKIHKSMRRRIIHLREFTMPDAESRKLIWQQHLKDLPCNLEATDVKELAARFEITGGLIKNAVMTAWYRKGGDPDPMLNYQDLMTAAKQQRFANEDVVAGEGDYHFETKFGLRDLILSQKSHEAIQQLAHACRNRDAVWKRAGLDRTLDRGKGIFALFYGPSGTGKSFAARCLAGDLDLPLKTINLSSLLSVWHGQTEKLVFEMFRSARKSPHIILLDECDSLLMKKENLGQLGQNIVNIFLKEMEDFEGIMIMTTNYRDALEKPLQRRYLFRIGFETPDVTERLKLWERLLPIEMRKDGNLNLNRLAERFEFTGGNIRNVLVLAAFRLTGPGSTILTHEALESICEEEKGSLLQEKKLGFK
jgi:SpoVK/Ycf46/Vps4 family AAA+-type ATPase